MGFYYVFMSLFTPSVSVSISASVSANAVKSMGFVPILTLALPLTLMLCVNGPLEPIHSERCR